MALDAAELCGDAYLGKVLCEYQFSSIEELTEVKKAIDATKSGFQTHISETKGEVDRCYEKRNMSPVEYFDSLGLFKYGGVVFHGIYLSDNDIDIFVLF